MLNDIKAMFYNTDFFQNKKVIEQTMDDLLVMLYDIEQVTDPYDYFQLQKDKEDIKSMLEVVSKLI